MDSQVEAGPHRFCPNNLWYGVRILVARLHMRDTWSRTLVAAVQPLWSRRHVFTPPGVWHPLKSSWTWRCWPLLRRDVANCRGSRSVREEVQRIAKAPPTPPPLPTADRWDACTWGCEPLGGVRAYCALDGACFQTPTRRPLMSTRGTRDRNKILTVGLATFETGLLVD
jgi:hypothetical protein